MNNINWELSDEPLLRFLLERLSELLIMYSQSDEVDGSFVSYDDKWISSHGHSPVNCQLLSACCRGFLCCFREHFEPFLVDYIVIIFCQSWRFFLGKKSCFFADQCLWSQLLWLVERMAYKLLLFQGGICKIWWHLHIFDKSLGIT